MNDAVLSTARQGVRTEATMMVDTIRALAAYGIAAVVTIAGLVIIYMTRDEPAASDLRVLIAGFIGSSLTFVYNQEVQTRTARQAASQTMAANVQSAAVSNGHDHRPIDTEAENA